MGARANGWRRRRGLGAGRPNARTDSDRAPPHGELVWEGAECCYLDLVSGDAGTCGDEATAEAYGVPWMLRTSGGGLLGLEPEPYEYVPAQVNLIDSYHRSPEGWELSQREMSVSLRGGPPPGPVFPRLGELFLRRLDQPGFVFRYVAGLCDQEQGSPEAPPARFAGRVIQLPSGSPQTIEYTVGDYLSVREALETVNSGWAAGLRLVWAELGTLYDFANGDDEFIPELDLRADVVRWAILLGVGDELGPKRPGQEYGLLIHIDATTGQTMGQGCCYSLVGGS